MLCWIEKPAIEPWCFAALAAVTSMLTKTEDMLTLETEASAPMLLEASESMLGMLLLQMIGKF